jgi:hypothetical protein
MNGEGFEVAKLAGNQSTEAGFAGKRTSARKKLRGKLKDTTEQFGTLVGRKFNRIFLTTKTRLTHASKQYHQKTKRIQVDHLTNKYPPAGNSQARSHQISVRPRFRVFSGPQPLQLQGSVTAEFREKFLCGPAGGSA